MPIETFEVRSDRADQHLHAFVLDDVEMETEYAWDRDGDSGWHYHAVEYGWDDNGEGESVTLSGNADANDPNHVHVLALP